MACIPIRTPVTRDTHLLNHRILLQLTVQLLSHLNDFLSVILQLVEFGDLFCQLLL